MPKSGKRSTIYALELIFFKILNRLALRAYNFFTVTGGYRSGESEPSRSLLR